ncbi:hypothetical protein [Faecalimonas sp.]
MKGIKKEIYVLREGLKTDITYVNGTTMIPIELHIADFELPIDSAAVVYSLAAGMSSPKKIVGEIKNNTVVFTPEPAFFNVGINVVQVRIVSGIKTLVTFSETVVCKNTMNFEDAGEVESQPTLVQQLLAKITECLGEFKKTEQNITEAIRTETANRLEADRNHEEELQKINKIYKERILTAEALKLVMEAGKIVDAMLVKNLNEDISMINKSLSESCVGFPDYTKKIAEYSNKGFTAPENCWARVTSTSGWTNTTLNVNGNGVIIQQIMNTDSYPIKSTVLIPLKKGDVVTMSSQTKVNGITALLYPMRK